MSDELDDATKNLRDALKKVALNNLSAEFLAKYGDPTDPNNPVTWKPSTRAERGLSLEERVHFLELDSDLEQDALGSLLRELQTLRAEMMMDKLKERGPEGEALAGLLKTLMESGGSADGPGNGHNYAGSAQGIAPDTIVDTVDGPIRADQIPGYREDPSWRPSPDWADANCTCPAHVAMREQKDQPGSTGFYL
jgi:hypothetical protein